VAPAPAPVATPEPASTEDTFTATANIVRLPE
jgi:hypothetical protein